MDLTEDSDFQGLCKSMKFEDMPISEWSLHYFPSGFQEYIGINLNLWKIS
jgi:hypothetical protein